MGATLHQLEAAEPYALASEEFTAAQWARLLGLSKKAFSLRQIPHSRMIPANGGLAKVYPFLNLPPDYQAILEELRRRQACPGYEDLLSLQQEPSWEPARDSETLPPASQTLAEKRKAALTVFWFALEKGRNAGQANADCRAEWLRVFGEPCNEKTVRRWVKVIEDRGGPDLAPIEAYVGLKSEHGKSVPHVSARLINKLDIPRELIAEYRCRCTRPGMMHMHGAYRSLVIDWQNGRPVPGLGQAPFPRAEFPFTAKQLRPFSPSTAARRQGALGKAAAARTALPHGQNSTASLRRMERVLLDDTRLDIIATDDLTGRPVELRSEFLMDLGARRVEAYVVREMGNILATDTDGMIARALRSVGLPARDAGYACTIRFERGAVACSAARETFLRSAFPGQIHIERTGVDGGRNYPSDFNQSSSGRWMDKAHIESFMRTLAFFVQHVCGQRGGSYERQPAALGLTGRNRKTGALDYTRGSQIHDGALLQYSERAIALYEGDLEARIEQWATHQPIRDGRLKISGIWPVSWVLDAVKEAIAYYNSRTDHRIEGFRRIEFVEQGTGKLKHRQESPNERAAFLNSQSKLERISEAAMSRLLMRARPVTVKRNGVLFDLAPYKGLRFWKSDSVACHTAGLSATGEKKMVALLDEDAFLHGDPSHVREIYLIGNKLEDLKAGEPAQFIEALPLTDPGVIGDAQSLARSNAELQLVQNRVAAELLTAAAPHLAARHAELRHNVGTLQAVVTANDGAARATAPDSAFLRSVVNTGARGVRGVRRRRRADPRRADEELGANLRRAPRQDVRRIHRLTPLATTNEPAQLQPMNLQPAATIDQLIADDTSPVPSERRRQIAEHVTSTPGETRAALYRALPRCELPPEELAFALSLFDAPAPAQPGPAPVPEPPVNPDKQRKAPKAPAAA